ncbi:MAG: hypothetical protein IPK83_18220 [Planctomycetes bacterium]|nr:hypothetical protein [Planctomycetota bacterium]
MTVQVMPERIDLEAFRRTLVGSRREVRVDRLQLHCEDVVRLSVEKFVKARDGATLVESATWDAFDAALAADFKSLGFECGLALGRDPRLTLRSIAFEESRHTARSMEMRAEREREEAARRERAAKAREAHLVEVSAMVEKVKMMADSGGALNVAELIRTFDVGQRGQLYQGLLADVRPDAATKNILAVAGGELLWIDPANVQSPMRRQALPTDAGALRSVRVSRAPGGGQILVGSRHGVHAMNENGEDVVTYSFAPREDIRGGVNAATVASIGFLPRIPRSACFDGRSASPRRCALCLTDFTEGSKAVRDVQADESGRVWLAVDNLAIGWRLDSDAPQFAFPAPGEITTLLIADGHAIAGLRDGSIVRWLIGDPKPAMETVRAALGKPVQSLEWISGGGLPRLLIGDGRPHLDLHVLGDSYSAQYRSLHDLRWGFAAEDLIAAVNDRRDHLFVWSPDSPDLPRGALAVGRATGRSIQDVALL